MSRPRSNQTRRANKRENDEQHHRSDANTNPQILIRFGREGSEPELREEEVVREDRNGEDVKDVPPQKTGLEQVGILNEAGLDVDGNAYGDGCNDDEAHNHRTLDDVGKEGDFEASKRWVCVSQGSFR